MKIRAYLIILLASMTIKLDAQREIKEVRPSSDVSEIVIDCNWANIMVRNEGVEDIQLEGMAMVNKGENDDAFEYRWEQKGKTLYFKSEVKNMEDLPKYMTYKKNGQEYTRKLAPGEKAGWRNFKDHDDDGDVVEMTSGVLIEVDLVFYIPANLKLATDLTYGNISLENIDNPMHITNTYGHVVATFDQMGITADCSISSTYSFVDVSIPQSAQLNLSLHTNYGEIYSDLEFAFDEANSIDEMYKNRIAGVLNKGGKELKLESPYNNVYLRKS